MAEKRQKITSLLLRNERKTVARVELFPASEWPDLPGSAPGLYRVRINRRWYCAPGQKHTFLSLEAVQLVFGEEVERLLEVPSGPCKPDLPRHTSVRVPNGRTLAGQQQYDVTRTATDPIQGIDGRWYVGVILVGRGTEMVPVDCLQVR